MTDSLGDFSRKLESYSTGINKANKAGVEGIARDVKHFAMIRVGSPTGRAIRLRNVGKKGARIGVSYDVKTYYSNVTAMVRAFGPFHFVERPIKPHDIPRTQVARYVKLESGKRSSKRELTGKATRDAGKRFIKFPNGGIRLGPIRHPGVEHGTHAFETGVRLANQAAKSRMEVNLNKALGKAF